uniref:solute carrier family 2, facilitated glucose transporter member 1 n=1 Tax=Ciona intestinalis TaxID=7719 RepID=UPI000052119C|nr:solute carrier family 2, facilitated glucose transporter member 1 [Ciona intestinalis]|eukprot:XP_002131186.1 solute carrier family 2, facilitated glucose transporter member 1 [Ciona intestinalis]
MAEPENSRFGAISLFFNSCLMAMTTGYHVTVLNPMTPVIVNLFNQTHATRYGTPMPPSVSTSIMAIVNSFIFVGGFVGGLSTKFLLGWFSPKRVMQIGHAVSLLSILIMALITGLTGSYEVLIVGRFFAGITVGVSYNLPSLMVAETSAPAKFGFWQSVVGSAVTFGILVAAVFGHPKLLGTATLWPVGISLAGVPSIIYLIGSIWLPESPFYLLRMKREDEAVEVLQQIRSGTKSDILKEISKIKDEMKNVEQVGIKEMFTNKGYRNQFFAVLVVYSNLVLVGVHTFVIYSDLIFRQAGIAAENVTFATIGVFALSFIASIFGSKIVDRFGGYKVNITCNGILIFAIVLFTISQATAHLAPLAMPYVSIVAVAIFMCAWSGGSNLAVFALVGKLTVEPTRATAYGYASMLLWTLSWFGTFIPPYLQSGLGAYMLMIWLFFAIVFLIYHLLLIPDTKKNSSEEIQAYFSGARQNNTNETIEMFNNI